MEYIRVLGLAHNLCHCLFKSSSTYLPPYSLTHLPTHLPPIQAGQTKFKTAAVEYIRALGLAPTVIASSNHLGNNDMLNLTSKKTLDAKMRVKSDIFAGWEEHIDHQVCCLVDREGGGEGGR